MKGGRPLSDQDVLVDRHGRGDRSRSSCQTKCLRSVGGPSIHEERIKKLCAKRSRIERSERRGNLMRGSSGIFASMPLEYRLSKFLTMHSTSSCGIAFSVSIRRSKEMHKSFVKCVMLARREIGTRIYASESDSNVRLRKCGASPPYRDSGRSTTGSATLSNLRVNDSIRDGWQRRFRTLKTSAWRPIRSRVRILDLVSSSEAASELRQNGSIGLASLTRMVMLIESGEERSIMACDQVIESSGVMDDQSLRRSSAAERQ